MVLKQRHCRWDENQAREAVSKHWMDLQYLILGRNVTSSGQQHFILETHLAKKETELPRKVNLPFLVAGES